MTALASLFAAEAPTVGIEIGARHVTVVRLAPGHGPAAVVSLAIEPLAAGAVVPALNEPNIRDRSAVSAAVARALEQAGARRRQAVLVVPDTVGRVSLLKFEKVPERPADLAELIRWQTRKSVPFRVEDAQLTFTPTGPDASTGEFAVVLARRDIVAEYESICAEHGVQIGIVDLATFNLINASVAAGNAPDGDWLLVNAAGDYLSLAILRGGRLLFFRHRGSEGEDSLEDVVHQTAMYYEDRLSGTGFSQVVLASAGRESGEPDPAAAADAGLVRRQLEQRLSVRVDSVDPRPAITLADRISIQPTLLDALAPALGLLLRERAA